MVQQKGLKQCVRDVIKFETIQLFESSEYFLAGERDALRWVHYTINTPIFTHCSTPTKKYSDILVLRQLKSILLK